MSRLRLAARLARRELRARPWRTLLVAMLVAVPVAGMIVTTTVVRTLPGDGDRSSFGRADLVVDTRGGPDGARTTFDAGSVLPGSTGVDIVLATVRLRTDDGRRLTGDLIAGPLDAPVLDGLVHLLSGRLPTAPDEVALSPSARSDLGVDVGDELVLRNTGTTLRVVGSVVNPRSFRSRLVVQHEISEDVPTTFRHAQTFVDLPGTPTARQVNDATVDVQDAGFGTFAVQIERPWEHSGEQEAVNWTYVGGALVLLVMGIVIAAAFAVGARRQLLTLGMLAGNGAEPSMLRSVLLVEGALCGVAGFVLGGALAAVVLTAAAPHRSFLLDRVVDGWVVRPIDVLPVAVLAIACALIAAVQPARSASRVSVLQALGGQRPAGPVPAWLVPVGAMSFLGGAALLALAILGAAGDSGSGGGTGGTIATLTAIAGGVAIVLGTTAWTPAIVGRLEPLASRVRGTWRLSARSLARQRARSSGVISSIAAAGALAVGVSAVVLSVAVKDADEVQQLPDDVVSVVGFATEGSVTAPAPETIARVEALLGGAKRVDVRPLDAYLIDDAPQTMLDGPVILGTPDVVAFLGAGDDALAALDAGRVVVLGEDGPRLRRLSDSMIGVVDGGSASEWPVPVVYLRGRDAPTWQLPSVLVPASVVDDLGIAPSMPERTLLRSDRPIGDAGRTALRALDEEIIDEQAERGVTVFGGGIGWNEPASSAVLPAQAALIVLALGFTLLVISIGLGLAAAEGRSERDVLVAVGAPPRSMAVLAGAKATVMATVGGVLAVPTAMVPVWVWSRASTPDEAFRVPWLVIVSLCIGVPVVAGVLTSACSAIGGRVHPVRGSSLAADS